jgi:hypothetical protein
MNKLTTSITALALAAGFSFATIAPASADQAAATRNQILGGLALIAGVATAVNVSNKNARANTIQGYTPDGSTVYQDGHVALADGQSYYPGNQNQSISCDNGNCSVYGNGYNGNGYNGNGYNNRYGQGRGWRR